MMTVSIVSGSCMASSSQLAADRLASGSQDRSLTACPFAEVSSPAMTLELLRNTELYDPEPRGRVDLLIGGERILWIGPDAAPLPRPYEVRETDLGGGRVLPGLGDGRVHLSGGGGEAGAPTRGPPQGLGPVTLGGGTNPIRVA